MEITKELKLVVQKQSSVAGELSKSLVIKTADDMSNATELFVKIKKAEKYVKGEKEKLTSGLMDSLKNIRAFFKPYEQAIENAKTDVQTKMIDFQQKEEAKAEKKIEKIEEKIVSGKITIEEADDKITEVKPEKKIETDSGKVSFKTVKDYEIIDETAIPKQYWELDTVKIRKHILAGVEIPGVKVVEKKILNTNIK